VVRQDQARQLYARGAGAGAGCQTRSRKGLHLVERIEGSCYTTLPKSWAHPRRQVEGGNVAGPVEQSKANQGMTKPMSYPSRHLCAAAYWPFATPACKTRGANHSSGIPALRKPSK
jgi:hypothetical protein